MGRLVRGAVSLLHYFGFNQTEKKAYDEMMTLFFFGWVEFFRPESKLNGVRVDILRSEMSRQKVRW